MKGDTSVNQLKVKTLSKSRNLKAYPHLNTERRKGSFFQFLLSKVFNTKNISTVLKWRWRLTKKSETSVSQESCGKRIPRF